MRSRRRTGVWVGLLLTGFGFGVAAPTQGEPFPEELVCWERDPVSPVFAAAGGDAWDQKIRERGWILVEDDVYHLWYTGYNEDRSPLRLLGHATSPDGIHWTRNPKNPIHTTEWVEDMCIIKHDGLYVMFAEGEHDIAHMLTSADGLEWVEHGPLDIRLTSGEPIRPGPRGTPTVWVEDGVWHLFYERGDQGIWLATSTDRQVWTNVQDDPVLPMGPDAYDQHAVALNQIIQRDGVYYAYYHANAHRPWRDWTTCVARSHDLIHWEKYPGNPILADNSSSGIVIEAPDGLRLYTMHPDVRLHRNPEARSDREP